MKLIEKEQKMDIQVGDRVEIVNIGTFLNPTAQKNWGIGIGSKGKVILTWEHPPFLAVKFDEQEIESEIELPAYYLKKIET